MASSTRQTTNYNRAQRLQAAVSDVFRRAIAFKWTHAETLAELQARVYANPETAKQTQYYRGYLRAVIDGHWRQLERETEWRLGPASGPTRTAGDPWTDEMSELCRIPGALYGAHFWKGSDKLYGVWKCTNEPRETAEVPNV